ncbi:MAG: hypothetical protein JRF31_12280, partial [Deltaproteobacteria bacterium]|nr:hypothetical protein [Deltaproteobacteria bacterium]
LSAEAKLEDFFLGNPKGFKSPQAMSVGSIHLNVDEKSLTKDTIIIDKIEVIAPEITYEKIRGTDNFQTILNNVKKAMGAEKTPEKPAEKSKSDQGKKILIKNFIVRNGKVNLAMAVLTEKTLNADLPDIRSRLRQSPIFLTKKLRTWLLTLRRPPKKQKSKWKTPAKSPKRE